jgi:hypothetical protein
MLFVQGLHLGESSHLGDVDMRFGSHGGNSSRAESAASAAVGRRGEG